MNSWILTSQNGCEKEDGFRVTNFPEKLKKQPGDSIDQVRQFI